MGKLSMSTEDYLEAIVMIGGDLSTPVRVVDIAEKLNVSKAAVSRAMSHLRDKGYLNQKHYGDITLTDAGLKYGRSVLEKHETLTKFLSEHVGIDPEVAESEACVMEHAISDESFAKLEAFIQSLES